MVTVKLLRSTQTDTPGQWCLDLVNHTMYGFNAELSVRSTVVFGSSQQTMYGFNMELSVRSTVVFGSSQPDDVWFQRGAQREIDSGVWI